MTDTNNASSTYVYDRLRQEAADIIAATGLIDRAAIALVTPKPGIDADMALPVFAAAKQAGAANPNAFAASIADAVIVPDGSLVGRVTAAGGFVNVSVTAAPFAAAVVEEIQRRGAAYGEDHTVGAGRTAVVEYSLPNIAKRMHVGHLRTTIIGHSIYLILKALGWGVIGDNHLGDWGTQFGYLLAAIHRGSLTPWDDPDPIGSLVVIYSEFYQASEKDPALKDDARNWFRKLETGDDWARATWRRLIDITLLEFNQTYRRLGIAFDTELGESFFEGMLDGVVQEAIEKGVAQQEPGGPVAVDFGDTLPSCLLKTTDGRTLYQTRDVATCIYRWKHYHPYRNIYVVGSEQRLHFQQVFEIVRRMGYAQIADCSVHIPFGLVTKANGERFAGRKGDVIFLSEVFDEAVRHARVKVEENLAGGDSEITADEIDATAEMLGIGAVIYSDLYQGPERNIAFDWDQMLRKDGNTATYIQYMHARCRSILRKSDVAPSDDPTTFALLTHPAEQTLLKRLFLMPHAVREAGEKCLPGVVADWTYQTAREFSRFYDACKVLQAETAELKAARLALVEATAQGIKNGLALLAIQAPDRM